MRSNHKTLLLILITIISFPSYSVNIIPNTKVDTSIIPALNAPKFLRGIEFSTTLKKDSDQNFEDDIKASIKINFKSTNEFSLEKSIFKLSKKIFKIDIQKINYSKESDIYNQQILLTKTKINKEYQEKLLQILNKKLKILEFNSSRSGLDHILDILNLSERIDQTINLIFKTKTDESDLTHHLKKINKNYNKSIFSRNQLISVNAISSFLKNFPPLFR